MNIDQKPNYNPKIVTIIGLFVLIAPFVGVGIPILMGDGMDNYSGAKAEAAEKAMVSARNANSGIIKLTRIPHIDNVRPATAEEAAHGCIDVYTYSSNPENVGHYVVEVSQRGLFGVKVDSWLRYGCRD